MPEPELPLGCELVRTTPTFDRETVPKGLLAAHQIAADVWGRLVVHSGELTFVFEDEPDQPIQASPHNSVVIPPARKHHLELGGPVTFAVEFYRH